MWIAESIGLILVGYGIWFASKGVNRQWGMERDWWRPVTRQDRYPYPSAGILLGVFFVLIGLRFALNNVWVNARILGYVGGGLFVVVVGIGVAQPRFLHPRWYGALEDRLGKKGMSRLRGAAFKVEPEEWVEVVASETTFDAWVRRTAPGSAQRANRGYEKPAENE
jgi:hypothetical protein